MNRFVIDDAALFLSQKKNEGEVNLKEGKISCDIPMH